MLDIEIEVSGDVHVARLSGHLDAVSGPSLKKAAEPWCTERNARVVLDLGQLTLVDSSGVGAIVSIFKRLRAQGGDLHISGLHGQPQQIFRLLRLDRAISIFATDHEAVEEFPP